MHAHVHAFRTKICKNERKKTFRYKPNGGAAMAEFPLRVKENILG